MLPTYLTQKSIWSYNPIPTGCVLYLPLWHPNLSGPAFKAPDRFGRECTLTGTTYGVTGRTFVAASTHRIQVGAVGDVELTGITDTTILVWAYPTSFTTEARSIISKNNVAGEDRYNLYMDRVNDTTATRTLYYENADSANGASGTAGAISVNNWYFFSVRYGSGGVKLETNLGDQKTNANTDPLLAEDGTAIALYLGRDYNNDYEYDGIIGEMALYVRYLPDTQIAHYYNTTKFRYT